MDAGGQGSGDADSPQDIADGAGSPDAGPPCTAVPLTPGISAAGWNNLSTEPLTVTQGATNHRGQDVVVEDGAEQVLIGKFAYGAFDKDLKGETVEVFVQPDPPCGPWVSLGVSDTSEDGQYGSQFGVEDDRGRAFFALSPEQQLPVGWYPMRMLVHGDLSVAAFRLIVVPPATNVVVFDIEACDKAGISKGQTFIIGASAGVDGTVAVSSYPEILPAVAAGPPANVSRPCGIRLAAPQNVYKIPKLSSPSGSSSSQFPVSLLATRHRRSSFTP